MGHIRITADFPNKSRWIVVFKAFSDPTRLKAALIIAEEEVSVQKVAYALDTTVQNASSHLRQLKVAGVARSRRDGKMVYYKLPPKSRDIIVQVQGFTLKM